MHGMKLPDTKLDHVGQQLEQALHKSSQSQEPVMLTVVHSTATHKKAVWSAFPKQVCKEHQ